MSDKFDFRNWITQNNVGPYSKMSSNKKLINENIEAEPIDGIVTATVDIIDTDHLDNLVRGTKVKAIPSGNYPGEYNITGPQNVVTKLLSDLGHEDGDYELKAPARPSPEEMHEDGDYELSENIEEAPARPSPEEMYDQESEMDTHDRAWGLVGNQLKDVIDTLRQDFFEDEDIMDVMRTALEQYDQVFPG